MLGEGVDYAGYPVLQEFLCEKDGSMSIFLDNVSIMTKRELVWNHLSS